MATRKRFTGRYVLVSILGLMVLITTFAIAEVLTQSQSVVLFALSILALLFFLLTRRLR